jgi:hypothetical protein
MKHNKGSILEAAVQYIKNLQRDKKKLAESDVKLKTMESRYQKLQIKTMVGISYYHATSMVKAN